jgi:KDO2-lipid IV(A) lauroyltransferase
VTLENLRQAFPEKTVRERRTIAASAYGSMILTVLDALTSHSLPDAALRDLVVFEDAEAFWADIGRGGTLIGSAHFGSWELLGEALCRRGLPINVVAKQLKGAFNEKLVENRLKSGVKLLPARGAVGASVAPLARGEVVVMMVDQSLASGLFVPFFGRPAATTPALGLVARKTGAPVWVAMGVREDDRIRVRVEGPIRLPVTGDPERDLADHTRAVTAAIEKHIRRHPEQWLWMHRRWKVAPPAAGSVEKDEPRARAG